jgi:putative modified peptide
VIVTGQQAADFVKRLETDDAFRQKLENDPAGALRDLGITVPAGVSIPQKVTLPSKQDVAADKPKILKFFPVFGPRCPIKTGG